MNSGADLLRIEDLGISFAIIGGPIHAVRKREPARAARQGDGAGRRIRLRQVGDQPGGDGHPAARRRKSRGRILFTDPADRRDRSTSCSLPRDGPEIRALRGSRIGKIFQEPMTSLSPLHTIGNQISEVLQDPRRHVDHGGAPGAHRGDARARRLPGPAPRLRHVSVRAVGRAAPARHDRHGADLPAGAADRRRADDGARRDDPGADPAAAARAADQAQHGDAADHPRSRRRRQCRRRGGGDLPRRDHGGRHRSRTSSAGRATPISRR